VLEEDEAASMPNASAQLEYMSLAHPGARPAPFHSFVPSLAMTHANLLCWFFWMEVSITIEIGCWALHRFSSWFAGQFF